MGFGPLFPLILAAPGLYFGGGWLLLPAAFFFVLTPVLDSIVPQNFHVLPRELTTRFRSLLQAVPVVFVLGFYTSFEIGVPTELHTDHREG
ncbi:MAG: hypothetical protein AAFX94_18615, partial [Myxococcota bacterium]